MPRLKDAHVMTTVKSRLCLLMLAIVLVALQTVLAADVVHQIRASYLYNFLQFVSFPPESLSEDKEIHVCILGVDLFGSALDEIDGASTHQSRLKIVRLGPYTADTPINQCNVLYFSASENGDTKSIINQIDPRKVLTISEYSPFIPYGGLIELYRKKDSIRFRINESLVKETYFKVAAQLVQLGVN